MLPATAAPVVVGEVECGDGLVERRRNRAAVSATGNTTWEHDFKAYGPLGLRDQRYTRIFLALARVSPPLAERMCLPPEWRADDPEPLRTETFPATELPSRPWQMPSAREEH